MSIITSQYYVYHDFVKIDFLASLSLHSCVKPNARPNTYYIYKLNFLRFFSKANFYCTEFMQMSMALSLKKDWKLICDIKFSSPPTELYGLYIKFEELVMLLPVFYNETNKFFSVLYLLMSILT